MDSKAECDQLNLAHETTTNASAHLVQYRLLMINKQQKNR